MYRLRLVIMGSGTLYPAFVGAIMCLAKAGYEISSVCGISSGALVAGALGTGYTPDTELAKLLKQTLASKTELYHKSMWTFLRRGGLIDSAKIRDFYANYMVTSFEETRIPTEIIATNVGQGSAVIFERADQISLSLAVSASMATPGLFTPVKINGAFYADGMSTGRLPPRIFESENEEVVILRVQSKTDQVVQIKKKRDLQFAGAVARVESNNRRHLSDHIFQKSITIESKYPSLSLDLTDKDVDGMISEGYIAADNWVRYRS